ncbi:MAG: ParB N-terminal domain-containing protein [Chloroflexi bacterium]|jgi:hypothetical protein|nr:ParB N-terminal domain-containing protein [Chloroflexota bacterium]
MTEPVPRVERVTLDTLIPHPRNPREGDIGAISESLRTFGQYRPIVVQRRPEPPHHIVAGSHTYRAAAALGWDAIDVLFVDVDDETAVRIMVADNRTHDVGRDDDELLATLLTELANANALDGTAYGRDDVDELLRITGRLAAGATGFLTSYGKAGPLNDGGPDPGDYVTIAFSMLPHERDEVVAVLRSAGGTQAEALLRIAREWSGTA